MQLCTVLVVWSVVLLRVRTRLHLLERRLVPHSLCLSSGSLRHLTNLVLQLRVKRLQLLKHGFDPKQSVKDWMRFQLLMRTPVCLQKQKEREQLAVCHH